jgi:2-iminobutanoate/2-iminopropanoate deaminase
MSPVAGPYSPVLRRGDWVVTAGQVGLDPESAGSRLVDGGTRSELTQALANLEVLLAEHGATLSDVVKTTLFLVDIADYGAVNEIWTEVFGEPRPTRTTVAVSALPLGARVEVEAWAYVPQA